MQTLREALEDTRGKRIALGHFIFSTPTSSGAIKEAARKAKMRRSSAFRRRTAFLGVREAVALVAAARLDGVELYLNADRTHTIDKVKEAIDAGSTRSFSTAAIFRRGERQQTREAVGYARASGRDVRIEGELGMIGASLRGARCSSWRISTKT